MIATLSGKLKLRDPGRLIVDTAGVGYEVFVPLSTYYRMPGAAPNSWTLGLDWFCHDCRFFQKSSPARACAQRSPAMSTGWGRRVAGKRSTGFSACLLARFSNSLGHK